MRLAYLRQRSSNRRSSLGMRQTKTRAWAGRGDEGRGAAWTTVWRPELQCGAAHEHETTLQQVRQAHPNGMGEARNVSSMRSTWLSAGQAQRAEQRQTQHGTCKARLSIRLAA